MNSSTALLNALLARGDYLESLSRDELVKILPILEQAHDEVLGRIAKTGGVWTKAWLEEQATEIDELYKAAAAKSYDTVRPDLEKLAVDEGAWIGKETASVALGISFVSVAPSLLKACVNLPTNIGGSTLDQLFEAMAINSREAVYNAISVGMVEGDTIDAMTRRLRGTVVKRAVWRKDENGKRRYYPGVYEGGAIEGVSTRQAETLSRTAVIHVGNAAREIFYKENGDLIKAYQCVETLDTRTCLICGLMDGRVFEPDTPRELLEHPDCRRAWVPVLKSWREMGIDADELPPGTRASMDGQVAETVTWADRLAKASPAKQDEMLNSPTRGRLYRSGVKLESMVKDGKIVPLKDMKGAK